MHADLIRADQEFGISVLKPSALRENVELVARCAGTAANSNSLWPAIVPLQSPEFAVDMRRPWPRVIWSPMGDVYRTALTDLMGGEPPLGDWSYGREEAEELQGVLDEGIKLFRRVLPETWQSLEAIVGLILLAKKPGFGGGTTSNRIGLIWLGPGPAWTPWDFVENLLHEFVHNCLFLEDMVRRIFRVGLQRLEADEALAISAIRSTRRGYDKAYHSAFVAYCLAELSHKARDDRRSRLLAEPLIVCLADLASKSSVLTDRGCELLDELIVSSLSLWDHVDPRGHVNEKSSCVNG